MSVAFAPFTRYAKPARVQPLSPTRTSLRRLRARLTRVVAAFFEAQAPKIVGQLIVLRNHANKVAVPDAELAEVEAILAGVDFSGWAAIVGEVSPLLEEVVNDGSVAALLQIHFDVETRPEITDALETDAAAYAAERGAELVGMRVDQLGRVVENPQAEWRIDEGTRDYLRATVRDAVAEGWSNEKLAQEIGDSYGFSAQRALVIARTETNRASNAGALNAYIASGVVDGKEWLTAEDDLVSEECQANGDAGVLALDQAFPSGDDAPPVHPNACFEGHAFASYGALEQFLRARYNGPAITIEAALLEDGIEFSAGNASALANADEGYRLGEQGDRAADIAVCDRRRVGIGVAPHRVNITIGPNHPMLTRRGFVPANQLRENDQLLYDARIESACATIAEPNLKQVMPFEDVFSALALEVGSAITAGARNYFHGDEIFVYGEVETVSTARPLLRVFDVGIVEQLGECSLVGTYPNALHVASCGACQARFHAVFSAASGDVGSGDLCRTLFHGHSLPSFFKNLRLVSCHRGSFSGYAFDASTQSGLYSCGGVVVKNCRCAVIPVINDSAAADNQE